MFVVLYCVAYCIANCIADDCLVLLLTLLQVEAAMLVVAYAVVLGLQDGVHHGRILGAMKEVAKLGTA